jgi:hypothetical protein
VVLKGLAGIDRPTPDPACGQRVDGPGCRASS